MSRSRSKTVTEVVIEAFIVLPYEAAQSLYQTVGVVLANRHDKPVVEAPPSEKKVRKTRGPGKKGLPKDGIVDAAAGFPSEVK